MWILTQGQIAILTVISGFPVIEITVTEETNTGLFVYSNELPSEVGLFTSIVNQIPTKNSYIPDDCSNEKTLPYEIPVGNEVCYKAEGLFFLSNKINGVSRYTYDTNNGEFTKYDDESIQIWNSVPSLETYLILTIETQSIYKYAYQSPLNAIVTTQTGD